MKHTIPKNFIRIIFAAAILPGCLVSCSSPLLKAPAVATSSFLKPKPTIKADSKISPFLLSGGSFDGPQKGIYIAPVSLAHLRVASKSLAKDNDGDSKRNQAARELAEFARTKFIEAFEKSPEARYKIRTAPGADCLRLELAIVELNRNSFAGTASRFVINGLSVPGTDAVLAKTTRGLKGNIAIEGKVTTSAKGAAIYQFADNEESRSAFLLPITDLAAYGQAREAIKSWAKQFEEVSRTPPGNKVADTGIFSLF